MNIKEIIDAIKNGSIRFEWTGSECGRDCVAIESTIFNKSRFALWIPKMTWENIEECLAKEIKNKLDCNEISLAMN